MKLLVVSSWFPHPPSNGSKLRAFNVLSRLAKRHEITLLSFAETDEGSNRRALLDFCADVQTVSGNPFKPARPLRTRDLVSTTPRSYVQTYSPQMQRLVDVELRRNHAAMAFQLGSALYLARHSTIPRVFEEAESGVIRDQYRTQSSRPARWRSGLTWWKFSRFLRQLVERFERTTVVSEIEHQHLMAIGCDRSAVRVVPNGVDREVLKLKNTPRPGRLIYPGSITYSANLDAVGVFVREILPKVRQARPDVTVLVTGSTGTVDLTELAGGEPVTFTGCVPDIASLVAHSSVCVVPLRIGGGTRLKILEAMAAGTPVVATTKAAEGLSVRHEENILIADTPDDFAAEVVRVMNDFVLRARLAANGRRLVERLYTWDRIGDTLEDVLDEACLVHRRSMRSTSNMSERAASATA